MNGKDPSGNVCVVLDGQTYCSGETTTVYGDGGNTSAYGLIEGLGDGADDRRNSDQERREREAEKGLCMQADGTMGQCSGDIPASAPTPTPTETPTPTPTPTPKPLRIGLAEEVTVRAVVEQRLAAFWDGFVPGSRYDPFDGLYERCFECKWSKDIGRETRNVGASLVATWAQARALAALGNSVTLLNSNRYWRINWSRFPGGPNRPQIRVGRHPDWNEHFLIPDFW